MRKPFTLSVFVLLLSVSPLSFSQGSQNWEIYLLDQQQQVTSTATMQCLPGGACDASSWTILRRDQFGCLYELDFSVQFSGSAVRLLLFQKALSSTCENIFMTVATGTGQADAPYPNANTASGEVNLGFEIRQQSGRRDRSEGTTRWRARRLPD